MLHHVTWFQNGGVRLTAGIQIDGLAVMMMFVVTLISLLVHVYSLEYMRGDRRFTYFYAAPLALHRVDAAARRRRQHAAAARRLGARRRVLVHADRPLVGGEAEQRRRAEGVPHHPHRRHRAADRRDHDVLRRAARHGRRLVQHRRAEPRPASNPQGRPHADPLDRGRADARDRRQVGSVPAAHLAARRHGRPHAGLRADPRGDDGRRRRLPRRARLPRVLQRLLDRRRRHQPDGRASAGSRCSSAPRSRSCRTTSRRCSRTPRSASSATW